MCFLVEGRQLHAHKCILTARCEAFRGMFNSAFREGNKGCHQVEMPEVSFDAFECMLRYIYGGARPVPEELAVEVTPCTSRTRTLPLPAPACLPSC